MTCGIYKITNTVTGDFYIGRSPNIDVRWNSHINAWLNQDKNYECKRLYESVLKHGVDVFKFEVIEECLISQINDREKFWIKSLKPPLNGKVRLLNDERQKQNNCLPPKKRSWRLDQVMKKYRITNRSLAAELKVHPTSIARLKTSYTLPKIDGLRLAELCNVLTKLSKTKIRLADLWEDYQSQS